MQIQRERTGRQQGQQHSHAPIGECQTRQSADDGEDDGFGDQLRDQAPASGANRHPYRNFLSSRGGARQQQVGHVGAGDQQNQTNYRAQHGQRLENLFRKFE